MIKLAKSAGFCIGVEKAVSTVYNNIGKGKLYTYGPIIHNKEVCRDLEKMGVIAIDSFDDIDGTVVIRSHGVPPSVYDTLMERNIHYIDCTCVFVKKIHEIAKTAYDNNLGIIIIGDKNHPEIIGINGWCNNKAVIINSEAECDDVPKLETGYVVVIQTTYKEEIANAYIDILKSKGHTLDIKNTICNATAIRQQEAYNLSKEVDIMVVIGDKSSSNTRKLYEICKKNCKMTYYIETINDLQLNICKTDVKIGITAGASTPLAIIKEVLDKMSDFAKEGMNDFEQMLDETFVALHNGLVVKGTVIRVGADETVSVNLGYKADGVIEKGEFSSDPTKKPSDSLKPGDEIEVFVVHVNDREGTVLLSAKRVELFKGMQEIEKAFEEKTPVTGVVTEIIRGGVIAVAKGAKIFIPASQLSNRFVEDLNEFKGQTITFEILELDKSKRRMIGGRKELQKREDEVRKSQVYATLNEGDIVSGVVRRLTDFGAFVDLGGVDGLIHVSELSWGRVKHAKDVLSEGETVEVSVLSIDKEKGKVSLSLKGVKANPWDNIETKYIVGEIYKGRVVRIVPFGAFIEMEEGVDGLVHISQISSKHIAKVEDALTVGDIIDVKVLEVVIDKKQISLSKKEADAPLEEETSPEEVLVEEVAPEEAPVVVEAEEAPLEAEVPAEDNTEE